NALRAPRRGRRCEGNRIEPGAGSLRERGARRWRARRRGRTLREAPFRVEVHPLRGAHCRLRGPGSQGIARTARAPDPARLTHPRETSRARVHPRKLKVSVSRPRGAELSAVNDAERAGERSRAPRATDPPDFSLDFGLPRLV